MEHVEVLRGLSEVCRAAIKSGDWKVDGACDPDAVLRRADAAIASLSAQQPAAVDEMAELVGLLDEVRSHFTRDDDLPDDLLPRIDAALAAQPGGSDNDR